MHQQDAKAQLVLHVHRPFQESRQQGVAGSFAQLRMANGAAHSAVAAAEIDEDSSGRGDASSGSGEDALAGDQAQREGES